MQNTKTILVVEVIEDEQSLLTALREKLAHEGFSFLGAKDGEEGLDLALQNHPDLILLDILMPKMDGLTMLKKLRENEWGKKVPVIILTNFSGDEKIAAAMENEALDYFIKSDVKLEEVVSRIKEKLG